MSVMPKEVPERLVTLGRICGVFGVKGWVRVQSFTRPEDNLLDYDDWWLAPRSPSPQMPAKPAGNHVIDFKRISEAMFCAEVLDIRSQGAEFVAQLAGVDGKPIDDRDLAACLIGREIQVDREAMPEPEEGIYYWADLIGLKVRSMSGTLLGVVTDLMDNGAQDVLIIDDQGEKRMIPFVRGPIVQSVDLDGGLIVVDWEADY